MKSDKKHFIRFVSLGYELVFDIKNNLSGYGYYVCNDNKCLLKLEKRKNRFVGNRKHGKQGN
ncbi:MAG: DUF448 domain-containing protein [Candidatus Cloacimonetes bacterium]|nr:DUF448 domain-containing protein [Candidatus Cloacimonadota bacterium]